MKKRKLGHPGLEVAPLAFGGNVFGWTVDQQTSFDLLDAFVDAGFNLIDTADVYSYWAEGNSGGESETIIVKWLHRSKRRDRVRIATKVGKEMGPHQKGLSASYIPRAVENSLQRLQTDYIDLYQSHEDDKKVPPEETLKAYDRLIKDGRIRAIGASNYDTKSLEQALQVSTQHGFPRYESLQPLYNLYDRADMVKKYLDERGPRILAALDRIAAECDLTPIKAALAWLIAQPGITAPIASATSLAQLQELIAATTVELDSAAMDLINEASAD